MSWHLLVHKQTLGQHLVRIPKAFPVFDLANIWLHPYFVCMRWKSTVAMNKYYIGYFCCTLYLVLLCWAHWSRRTAATGSSLLASGSHLSFPWVLVTASHKETRFHYEDIGLCKKIYIYHFHVQVHLSLNYPTFVIQSSAYLGFAFPSKITPRASLLPPSSVRC